MSPDTRRHSPVVYGSDDELATHHPLWLACSYDRQTTPEPIVETLLRTHPEIFDDGRPQPSEPYADASDVVHDLTPEPQPLPELAELELVEDPRRPCRRALRLRAVSASFPSP